MSYLSVSADNDREECNLNETWHFNRDVLDDFGKEAPISVEDRKTRVIPLRARIAGDSLPSSARPSYVAYERSSFAFTIERIERRPSLVITVARKSARSKVPGNCSGLRPRAKVYAIMCVGDHSFSLYSCKDSRLISSALLNIKGPHREKCFVLNKNFG